MNNKFIFTAAMLSAIVLFSGCGKNFSSTSYNAQTVGSASAVYPCTVVSSRIVNIEEEDTQTGMLVGAAAGGLAGNMIGKGKGRVASTGIGALLGGFAGSKVQEGMNSQQGLEYMVRLDDGSMRSIVQGMDVRLNPGQRAHLIVDPRGRSRLVAI